MLASLQYEKENRHVKSQRPGYFKDVVDTWNLFLLRIPDRRRRNFIVNKKYPMKAVKYKFKLDNLSMEQIELLFNNPPRLGQYLLGPLVNEADFLVDEEKLLISKEHKRVAVLDFDRNFEMKLNPQSAWCGVDQICQRIKE